MFLLFISFFSNLHWNYDLKKPFTTKNLTDLEYGWSIFGNAAATKQFIRLTSAITENFGGVCQQKPTLSSDWTAELEIRARDGNGGAGFWIFYSSEFCVAKDYDIIEEKNPAEADDIILREQLPKNWDGFALWINTTNVVGKSLVYLLESSKGQEIDYKSAISKGPFNVRGDEPLTIKLTKRGNYVQARFSRGYNVYNFDETFKNLPEHGYFTIMASTLEYADNNDLISFRFTENSAQTNKDLKEDTPYKNRLSLLLNKDTRRQKKQRRYTDMKTSMQYDQERKEKEHKLDGKKYNFKDAFQMAKEASLRSLQTITIESLQDFIVSEIDKEFSKTIININLQMTRFNETKQDVEEIWLDLKNKLRDLTMKSRTDMAILGKELIEMAKKTTLPSATDEDLDDINAIVQRKSIFISFVLILVCVVEVILYIIWFLYKLKKTDHFKKAD